MPEDITQITAPDGTICNIRDKNLSLLNEKLEDILETGGEPVLISKTITENGTYRALDDNANGYREVTVDVASGGSIIQATVTSSDTSKITVSNIMCYQIENIVFGRYKVNRVGSSSQRGTITISGLSLPSTTILDDGFSFLNKTYFSMNNTKAVSSGANAISAISFTFVDSHTITYSVSLSNSNLTSQTHAFIFAVEPAL